MYQVSLKSEGVRPLFVITWPGITHVQIPFINFKNRLSHCITTAMYNSVLTHITMSEQDKIINVWTYKTSTVC